MAGQTSYAQNPVIGEPGQLFGTEYHDIVSYVASGTIPFGSVVELSGGKVRVPQATGSTLTMKGVALQIVAKEQALGAAASSIATTWVAGDVVPVLRKGRCFALWNGTTQSDGLAPNVTHSSTTGSQGYFTDAATSTTAGSEIAAAPAGVVLGPVTGQSTFCLVELNLP